MTGERFSGSEPSETGDTGEHTFVGAAGPQNAAHDATGPVAGRTQDTEPSRPLTVVRKDGSVSKTRPPFEAGNTASLRHGARSEPTITAKVLELRAALFEVAPDLDQPRFHETIERYLRAVAREKLLHDYLMAKGPEHVGQRLWEAASASANAAQKMSHELGLTPAGFHRLKLLWGLGVRAEHDVAALEGLAARGAEIRASHFDAIDGDADEEPEP